MAEGFESAALFVAGILFGAIWSFQSPWMALATGLICGFVLACVWLIRDGTRG